MTNSRIQPTTSNGRIERPGLQRGRDAAAQALPIAGYAIGAELSDVAQRSRHRRPRPNVHHADRVDRVVPLAANRGGVAPSRRARCRRTPGGAVEIEKISPMGRSMGRFLFAKPLIARTLGRWGGFPLPFASYARLCARYEQPYRTLEISPHLPILTLSICSVLSNFWWGGLLAKFYLPTPSHGGLERGGAPTVRCLSDISWPRVACQGRTALSGMHRLPCCRTGERHKAFMPRVLPASRSPAGNLHPGMTLAGLPKTKADKVDSDDGSHPSRVDQWR